MVGLFPFGVLACLVAGFVFRKSMSDIFLGRVSIAFGKDRGT